MTWKVCIVDGVPILHGTAAIQSEQDTLRFILFINWLAYQDRVIINQLLQLKFIHNSYLCLPMLLGIFPQQCIRILLSLHQASERRWSLSCSQNPPSLVTLPILSTCLLVNQHFTKPIQVTNLYRMQEHFPQQCIFTQCLIFNFIYL